MRIVLSWCHRDRRLKELLLRDLLPALGLFRDLEVQWWEDSHLTCGEEFTPGIVQRFGEADFGLLLLTSAYFSRPFIREHELPRFAGPDADKGSLPVALGPLPPLSTYRDLGGIERQLIFGQEQGSYAELSGIKRTIFANALADAIRARVLDLNGFEPL
ncbi:hypothetical protein AB0K00_14360 [Dactylosporangium sp. NPDC049525]|uniref:hypothetical protein n=1 Tax=Dactylosporangium sp. NPDC049525 TaxID=3154730 RepID=UPI0034408103